MNFPVVDGLRAVRLEMIETVALAALVLGLGWFVRGRWRPLDRLNIPAPVVGGLLFAALALVLRETGTLAFDFDLTLQTPLMIAFFTTVGLTAGLSLLRTGGPQIVVFWSLAALLALLQNGAGTLLAGLLGQHPFLGLAAGSVTMTGGHATSLAFGPVMEQLGLPGATTAAVAAATFGLVAGGLVGGPAGTWLIRRRLVADRPAKPAAAEPQKAGRGPADESEISPADGREPGPAGARAADGGRETGASPALDARTVLMYLAAILVCMGVGSIISDAIAGLGITLPAYIGAMIAAVALRNTLDLTGLWRMSNAVIELLGAVALNLFLAMALMSLRLWELRSLAVPLIVILAVQVALTTAFALTLTFRLMGRDREAAVMAAGHCGFGLGATPNAVANMTALVEKYGPAPRAFLVVPLVGAFLNDFTNALIITVFLNLLR